MKYIRWMGWLLATLLFVQNAGSGFAASSGVNPLEGHLLRDGGGTLYLYHDGLRFLLQTADVGDRVIEAIPVASADQWDALFSGTDLFSSAGAPQEAPAGEHYPAAPGQPEPFPGYS